MGRRIERRTGGAARWPRRAVAAAVTVGLLAFAVQSPAHADEQLTKGSGAADATVVSLNIPYAGANIGANVGHVDASFLDDTAKSSAISVDLAFLRLATVLQACPGAFPIDLPDPTMADTNAAGQKPDSHRTQLASGVGDETAAAEPGSHATSGASAAYLGIPGVAEVGGGRATSEVRLDAGAQRRTMGAEVRSGTLSLAGGLVELEGMRWRLQQVATGPDHRSTKTQVTSSFTIGSITLAGVPLPAASPDQVASSIATVNQAMQGYGLQIRLPKLQPYGRTGQQLTPLVVALGGDTAYGASLYELIAGGGDTSLVNLFNSLLEPAIFDPSGCQALLGTLQQIPQLNALVNTVGLLTPIILSAFAAGVNGGAEVDLEVGGARTTYDDTYYPPRAIPVPTTSRPVAVAAPAAPVVSGAPAAPPAVIGTTPTRTRVECRTTSPVGHPGCSKGAAALAATLGAAATLGLAGADELGRRRRRRPTDLEAGT